MDLADALAARMGRTARFVQNQWDGLVPGLERGEYDVVINGLEITPERAEKINFSNPYFYSTLTLTTRLDDTRIRSAARSPWNDVRNAKGHVCRAIPSRSRRRHDPQL